MRVAIVGLDGVLEVDFDGMGHYARRAGDLMTALVLTLALSTPADAASTNGKLLASWQALMAAGCDTNKAHVNTGLEARILRNVPFAREGYVFKTLQFTRMFEADGGWYKPVPGKTVTLSTTEQACVDTLKAKESALRAAQPMTEATYDWMLWNTDLYLTLRSYTGPLKLMSGPKTVEVGSGCFGDGKGGLRWLWLDSACPSAQAECSGVVFECDQDCQCTSGIGG